MYFSCISFQRAGADMLISFSIFFFLLRKQQPSENTKLTFISCGGAAEGLLYENDYLYQCLKNRMYGLTLHCFPFILTIPCLFSC